ncbi:unnamed protein product [Phytophthora lilii]|uniref:Unnamed protein product n=1 Tax=Phytophthora lilii TaxID=2077276 RepID=A0A9W6XNP5_9STRA|nr:unnamed protein product [Phytophthora lilii]
MHPLTPPVRSKSAAQDRPLNWHSSIYHGVVMFAVFLETAVTSGSNQESNMAPWISDVWKSLGKVNQTVQVAYPYAELLDQQIASGQVFNYPGSLTAPPCSEIVDWWVLALYSSARKAPPEKLHKDERTAIALRRKIVLRSQDGRVNPLAVQQSISSQRPCCSGGPPLWPFDKGVAADSQCTPGPSSVRSASRSPFDEPESALDDGNPLPVQPSYLTQFDAMQFFVWLQRREERQDAQADRKQQAIHTLKKQQIEEELY